MPGMAACAHPYLYSLVFWKRSSRTGCGEGEGSPGSACSTVLGLLWAILLAEPKFCELLEST